MRLLRWIVFLVVLRPLILRDYRLREAGRRPDRWHWADHLAMTWGYTVDLEPSPTPTVMRPEAKP